MIKCPKCNQTLMDSAVTCQFCGADTKSVPRPITQKKEVRQRGFQTAPWIWPAYYACAGWYIFTGLVELISAVVAMNSTNDSAFGKSLSGFFAIGLIIGAINVIVGFGLILKVEFIRGITKIFCFLQLGGALMSIGGIVMASGVMGPAAYLYLGQHIVDLVSAGLMIYLLGETD